MIALPVLKLIEGAIGAEPITSAARLAELVIAPFDSRHGMDHSHMPEQAVDSREMYAWDLQRDNLTPKTSSENIQFPARFVPFGRIVSTGDEARQAA